MKTRKHSKYIAAIAVALAAVLGALCGLAGCSRKDGEVYYTVKFNSNGGSAVESQSVEAGKKVKRPVNPTLDGYSFIDWYSDVAFTKAWGFETMTVESNMTLYAKWGNADVTYYTVKFDTDGGSAVDSQRVKSGDKADLPSEPTKDGYTFDGWYADAARGTAWNFNTDTISSDTTIYVKWLKLDNPADDVYYTVTFDTNGGSAVNSQSIKSGETIDFPVVPTKDGYEFGGWYADAALTTPWNIDVDTIRRETVIYAKWDPIGGGGNGGGGGDVIIGSDNVTATFNIGLSARKAGLSNPVAQTVKSNSKLNAPNVTRNGYTLDGWYIEDGNTAWNFGNDRITKNTTLFARWTRSGSSAVSYEPSSSMRESNTLYIHYLRMNGDYDKWSLWVWGSGNGTKYSKQTVDQSGAVYKIPSFGSSVNFKPAIIEGNNWLGEDGGDCSVSKSAALKVGESYHWFVKEGETGEGTPYLTAFESSGTQTESPRASSTDVIRSNAANIPVFATATDCEEMGVGYQIFVASFCDSDGDGVGDLRGIINKLDYLGNDLNVDVLWLTPIQMSDSYHGYDCYDYYGIDPKFGTNADYRELVYKAHQRGMKVIMDLVVNHTSTRNEWFVKSKQGVIETVTYQDGTTAQVKYRDFYRWSQSKIWDHDNVKRSCDAGGGWYYYSSFGSSMPELNYDCQAVRNAMADVGAYWMNFGLDGFRMDAIKHVFMWDESTNSGSDDRRGDGDYIYNLTKNVEFFKEFNYKLKSKYPHCFLLGEQLDGNADNVAPFYAGMDSLFDFCTFFNLPNKIKGGNVSDVCGMFNNNSLRYNQYRGNGNRPINSMISSNHDLDRLQSQLSSEEQRKLYFAIIMTMPGLSWIYYGDEIGLVGYHVSQETGDDGRRQSMKWTSNWENKCTAIRDLNLNNSTVSVADQGNNSLLSYVKELTRIRNANPTLINGTANCSNENGLLKITVTSGSETIVVYHNLSNSSKTVDSSGISLLGGASVGAYGTAIFKR